MNNEAKGFSQEALDSIVSAGTSAYSVSVEEALSLSPQLRDFKDRQGEGKKETYNDQMQNWGIDKSLSDLYPKGKPSFSKWLSTMKSGDDNGREWLEKLRVDFISPRATKLLKDWFRTEEAASSQEFRKYDHVDGEGRVFSPENTSCSDGSGYTYLFTDLLEKRCSYPSRGWKYPKPVMDVAKKKRRLHFIPVGEGMRRVRIKRYLLDSPKIDYLAI